MSLKETKIFNFPLSQNIVFWFHSKFFLLYSSNFNRPNPKL